MFRIIEKEWETNWSQIVTSSEMPTNKGNQTATGSEDEKTKRSQFVTGSEQPNSKPTQGETSSKLNNSSQIVTSSLKHRGNRYLPFAFTEQGVAMLSVVLSSEKAIDVNISIMRAFVMIKQYALTYAEHADRIAKLEHKIIRSSGMFTRL